MLPFTYDFRGNGKGAKVNLDNLLPNLDLLDDGFDDGALFLGGQGRPSTIQVTGLGQNLILAEQLNLEEVDLSLEPGQFGLQSLEPLFERLVRPAESLRRDLISQVQAVGLVHLLPDLARLGFERCQTLFLGLDLLVCMAEVPGHVLG